MKRKIYFSIIKIGKVFRCFYEKTWYRYIIYGVVSLAYFFVYFHRTSLAVMAPELANAFNITPATIGILGSMYFYGYAAGQLPAGILADRWGARKTISLFILLAGLGSLIFGFSPGFKTALVGRLLIGIGVGFVYVPGLRLLTDWFRKNEFATYTGLLLAVGNTGSLASTGPLVGLMATIGWRNLMILVGVFLMATALLAFVLIRNKPSEIRGGAIGKFEVASSADIVSGSPMSIGRIIKLIITNYNFWTITVLFFSFYGSIMGFQGLWAGPYLMSVYGLSKGEAGKILTMIPIGMIIGGPLSGIIADKVLKSKKKVILMGTSLYILTWIPLVFMIDAMSYTFLAGLFLFYGIFGAFFVIMYTNLKENLDLKITATGIGFINVFVFIGGAVYQQVMAAIISKATNAVGVISPGGFKSAFFFCFITLVVSVIFFATQKEPRVDGSFRLIR